MQEDALGFVLLGRTVYVYGLYVALGCLIGLGLFFYLNRRDGRMLAAAATGGLLALPLGFLLARLLFVLGDPGFWPLLSLKNILDISAGGYAMFGALTGAVLATLLSARWHQVPAPALMDRAVAGLLAFLIPARLGEGATTLGLSRPLTLDWLAGSLLARRDEYDAYLRTYLLEAALALVILVVVLAVLYKGRRDGLATALAALLFGISQTLMESLRYDGHLRHSFVGVQQVLAAALFACTLICLARRQLRRPEAGKALPILTLALLPLILAAIVGVEFLVDRSQMGKLASYGLYLLVLCIPLGLGILLLQQEDRHGQRTA